MSPTADISIISSFKTEAREKGVSHVTIGNVADRCGCARQTIYYHFCGTMKMIRWIVDNECMDSVYNPIDLSRWKNEMYRILCVLKSNDWLFKELYESKLKEDFRDYLLDAVQKKVIEPFFMACTIGGSHKNTVSLERILTYGFVGQAIDWLKREFKEDPLDIMQDLDRFCGASMYKVIEDYLMLRPNEVATIP